MANPSKTQAFPTRGRSRGETSKASPSVRARSPRTACNFCHDKRVKCVMAEGETRCEQCIQRDTNCVFSTKAKTGPKPKSAKSKAEGAARHKGKSSRSSARRVRGTTQMPSVLPRRGSASGHGSSSSSSSSSFRGFEAAGGSFASRAAAAPTAQPPVEAGTAAASRERLYLSVFIGTVGKLVPLVREEVLSVALRERQRLPQDMATAVGADLVACEQAQVVGAISLGALISGDQEAAHAYYLSLRYHLGDVNSLTGVGVVPSLALVALYWQHQGEDELKIEWVGHARRVLANVQIIPANLVLSIEYLDYAREAHPRPGVELMPWSHRALHSISCLLANMPAIVNPAMGRAAAIGSCEELNLCILGLRNEASVELTLLLCTSLRALLLAMLGQRDAATDVLDTIPSLVDVGSGGNPSVVRALPLSWDALLIASALSFLLGQGATYQRLRSAVELATDVPAEARWTFCLPEPGSDPQAYVVHECNSSSNICNIMCEIASRTNFGAQPFYSDEQQKGEEEEERQLQQQPGLLHPSTPMMPSLVLTSPHRQVSLETAAAQLSGEHRYGYGPAGKTMRRMPSNLQGNFAAVGSGADVGDVGMMPFIDGGFGSRGAGVAEGGGGITTTVSEDMVLEGDCVDPVACKRRRMMTGEDGGDPFDPSAGSFSFPQEGGDGEGHGHMPLLPPTHPGSGGTVDAAGHYDSSKAFGHRSLGIRGAGPGKSLGGGTDGDEGFGGGSLGLTRDLHNMSLSRLSVPSFPDHGGAGGALADDLHLGRMPSEGIMDLSSSMGSFNLDMVGLDGGGGGGGVKSGKGLGSFTTGPITTDTDEDGEGGGVGGNSLGNITFPAAAAGGSGSSSGKKRSFSSTTSRPLRLASFTTYSPSLCRTSSSSSMPRQPFSGGGGGGGGSGGEEGSIGQCGSDLGHDIVASAEDFMNEEGSEDICGNILSVDAILGDIGSNAVGKLSASKDGNAKSVGEGAATLDKPRIDAATAGEGGGGAAAAAPGENEAGGGGSPLRLMSGEEGGGSGGGGGGGGDISTSLDQHKKSITPPSLADFYETGGTTTALPAQP
ncbi:unnamed protein product [Ectocarpus fasciculatus]